MSLQSTFKFWTFMVVILFLVFTALLILIFSQDSFIFDLPPLGLFIFIAFLLFCWIWLFYGEMRTKTIKVTIENDEITVAGYLGLGPKNTYRLSEFDGLQTAILPSRYDSYEYLYLMYNRKKMVKISQFYHKNYEELKNALLRKVRNLGQKDFSFLQEIKEIFT